MTKCIITIGLILHISLGFAQEVSSLKVIDQALSIEEFRSHVHNLTSYRKLKNVAQTCSQYGKYEKAALAYQYMADEFTDRISKEDVGEFYACLLKVDRIDEVPYQGLEKLSREFPDLLKIARIRREVRDNKRADKVQNVRCLDSREKLVFGYSVQDKSHLCVYSDSLKQIYTYEVTAMGLENPEVFEHGFKKGTQVLAVEKVDGENCLYTIFDENLGLYRIEIVSKYLPPFTHNSRYYSTGMPWFDAKTNCLFFCADNKKGYGGWDIYFSELDKDKWLKPELLDERVNTPFDEMFPTVTGNALLYSSDGRKGKGGLDNYAYDMANDINYNLIDCNSTYDDYCVRLSKENNSFYTCRNSKILKGSYSDFWMHTIKEEEMDDFLLKKDRSLAKRLEAYREEKQQIPIPQKTEEGKKPTVYHFDCGEITYPAADAEEFDQKCHERVKKCVDYFSTQNDALDVLVFASAHQWATDNSNYLLSLKRARRMIAFMKKFSDKPFVYKSILLGDKLETQNQSESREKIREVFCKASNFSLPFDLMIAVPSSSVASLQKLADCFNNSLADLEKLNGMMASKPLESFYLVGIQTIHRVYEGETMYSLAARYSCSVEDIMGANAKTSSLIRKGELLLIPLAE